MYEDQIELAFLYHEEHKNRRGRPFISQLTDVVNVTIPVFDAAEVPVVAKGLFNDRDLSSDPIFEPILYCDGHFYRSLRYYFDSFDKLLFSFESQSPLPDDWYKWDIYRDYLDEANDTTRLFSSHAARPSNPEYYKSKKNDHNSTMTLLWDHDEIFEKTKSLFGKRIVVDGVVHVQINEPHWRENIGSPLNKAVLFPGNSNSEGAQFWEGVDPWKVNSIVSHVRRHSLGRLNDDISYLSKIFDVDDAVIRNYLSQNFEIIDESVFSIHDFELEDCFNDLRIYLASLFDNKVPDLLNPEMDRDVFHALWTFGRLQKELFKDGSLCDVAPVIDLMSYFRRIVSSEPFFSAQSSYFIEVVTRLEKYFEYNKNSFSSSLKCF